MEEGGMTDREKAILCLDALSPSRAVPHETWVQVGMALHEAGCAVEDWARWFPDGNRAHDRVCRQKWASFGRTGGARYTVGSFVQWARQDSPSFRFPADTPPGLPETIGWDTPIPPMGDDLRAPPRPACAVHEPDLSEPPDIDLDQLPPETIPEPAADWPTGDVCRYLATLYRPGEIVAYVLDAIFDRERQKWTPGSRGVYGRTAKEIAAAVRKHAGDVAKALGAWRPEAGAWCRLNPMDGKGVRNENVVEFRHVLAESDDLPIERQLAVIRALNLPCTAIVHSGGKSVHAIVKVDAGTDAKLYRERVDFLFGVLDRNGFKVDRQCRNPSRLSRLPGVARGERRQYLISGPCGAASWATWEAAMKADTDPLPEVRSIADYVTPQPGDPAELLQHRFLCRGGALLFVGPTGVGKSSCVLQAAFRWCLGQDFFGIQAAREMKILVIQAENDDGDIAEVRNGVLRGLAADMVDGDEQRIAQRIFVVCEDSSTGKEFGAQLDRLLAAVRPDLVIVDPALAYLGGDALKQADVTAFCRNVLNPVIHRHNVGLILVHHTNKPPRNDEKDTWKAGDLAYLGQGAADWANWARAVMAIVSKGSHSHFELCLGKRGGRVGWGQEKEDGEWQKTYSKPIAHAKEPGVICWREPDDRELFDEAAKKSIGKPKKDWNDARSRAVEIAKECARTKAELIQECMKRIGDIDSPNTYQRNIKSAIEAARDGGVLEFARVQDGVSPVYLVGPSGGSVTRRADEIRKASKNQKQRQLAV
jgi:RecA-family ATPase